jgi:hypothetical protein
LRRLWRGELPLADAFWSWAVIGGLALNLAASFAMLVLLTQGETAWAMVAGHAVSLPYNVVVTIGVWRSAARYQGSPHWARAARLVTLIGMAVLSII